MSLSHLVATLDSFQGSPHVYSFIAHNGTAIGYILPIVAELLSLHPDVVQVDHGNKTVTIDPALASMDLRNEKFALVLAQWRAESKFEALQGWRNELYTVYNPSKTPYMLIERAFSGLLGVVTYGVHINGYVPLDQSADGRLKLWVPRRSYKKPTCPGQLDNTVAGGIGHPYGVYETCIKECQEEAGLSEEYTKAHLAPLGVVSYIYQKVADLNDENAVIQPEVEFVYDLKFVDGVEPKPFDGEVHEFYLLDVEEVVQRLKAGEFKYNCAGIMIDFLVRFGFIDSNSELDYLTILQKLHRTLPFPTM